MAKQKHNPKEQQKAKKYHDTFEAKEELYKLMKRVAYATGLGEEEEDYTKTLSFDIGEGTLTYDPYYQRLIYYDSEDREYEIEEDDLETVHNLIKEIEARFKAYEKRIEEIREKAVKDIFNKPIDKILNYKE